MVWQLGKFLVDTDANEYDKDMFEVGIIGKERPLQISICDFPDSETVEITVTNTFIHAAEPLAKIVLSYEDIRFPAGACMAE